MHDETGRFFRKANSHNVSFSNDVLSVNGRSVFRKMNGHFDLEAEDQLSQLKQNSTSTVLLRNRLEKIVQLLNEGKQAEAILTASLISWPSVYNDLTSNISKWHFNRDQPRDNQGRWTDGDGEAGPSALLDVQYRGHFHDLVVDDLLQGLESNGSTVLKNVRVLGLNMILAIPDGASRPDGWGLPYFIEVKTGFDPRFTPNQDQVYPLICLGGHATSFDTRITQLGLTPGAPFPPLDIMLVHTFGPGLPLRFDNYCELIGLRPHHAP